MYPTISPLFTFVDSSGDLLWLWNRAGHPTYLYAQWFYSLFWFLVICSSFSRHRVLQLLWLPLESFSKTDALLTTIPLVTKQKIRIDASDANQESKSQSELIRVNCREFQVVQCRMQMVSHFMECTVRGYTSTTSSSDHVSISLLSILER